MKKSTKKAQSIKSSSTVTSTVSPVARSVSACAIGFNGELFDELTGCYYLGDGYRLYNPALRAFYSPDSFSPFGVGGVNRYQYCRLNPVNYVDPTGHVDWRVISGIILGALGIIVGIALAIPTGGASLSLTAVGVAVVAGVIGASAIGVGIASIVYEQKGDIEYADKLAWISYGLGASSLAIAGGLGGAGSVSVLQGAGVLTTATGSGMIFAGVATDSDVLKSVGTAFTAVGLAMVGGGMAAKAPRPFTGPPRGLSYPPNQPQIISGMGLRRVF